MHHVGRPPALVLLTISTAPATGSTTEMIGSWREPTTVMPGTKRGVTREDLAVAVAVAADEVDAIAMRPAIHVRRPPVAALNRAVVPIRAADHNRDEVQVIAAARVEIALAVGLRSSPSSRAAVRAASVAA
jgi:hypothetical protein